MTAKTKRTSAHTAKQSLVGAAVGIAVSLVASLITAWVALKTKNPLSVADTMASICVLWEPAPLRFAEALALKALSAVCFRVGCIPCFA